MQIKNKQITSSAKYRQNYYKNNSNDYSNFSKKKLREKMFNLFKGNTENELKALKIVEEFADKSKLPLLRKGLKDINS